MNESFKKRLFQPLDTSKIRVFTLNYPKLKLIAFVGQGEDLKQIPVGTYRKGWTYFIYDELTTTEQSQFNLCPGEHVEIHILEDNRLPHNKFQI